MRKKRKKFLAFLCFLLMLSFFAHAQTTEIIGKVTSTEGEPLPGAEVTVTSPNLIGGAQSKITDGEGKFRFVALLPGTYEVEAKLQGFTPQQRADLRLSAGKTLTVNFALEIGSLEEEVTVIGEAPIIDVKDSQTVTTNFKTEFLQKLPNRGVESALEMTPGVTSLSAFGSAESNSNNYLIQGVKVNDPEGGEQGLSVDYDSIEELNVMGIAAPAEYGGFSGAVINTVMKSGGNDFHGLVNLFFRLPSFHSENWSEYGEDFERKRFDENYDGNFNLGGPLVLDKLWFFTSARYGYQQEHEKDYDGPTEGWRGLTWTGKLTWQAGINDRFSLWGGFDRNKVVNYGFDPEFMAPETNTDEKHRNWYFNSNYLHTFSDTTFLEVKVGGFRNKGENGVDPNGTPPRLELTTDYLTGNYWSTYYRTALRVQANAALSHHAEDFIKGDHDFKLGVEFEFSKVTVSYFYPSDKMYLDYYGENYIMDEWDGEEGNPEIRNFTGFVQDSWSISDRLVINPGLRISTWRGYVPGVEGAAFAPKTGIAPRIGLTFDVFGDASTAIKAHYGKYYHGIFGQFFFRLQPQGGFREYLWEDGEWVLDWEDNWEQEYTVDPNIKTAYMNQYVIGIERELGRDLSIGVSFIYRTNHDMQDRVNLTGEWVPTTWTCDYEGTPYFGKTYNVYERLNPGDNQFYLTNPQEGVDYGQAFGDIVAFNPTRKYRGIQINFEKRYSNGWMLSASYVYGKAWGTDDNAFYEFGQGRGSMFGASTMYSNPNYQLFADGPLDIDRNHQLKIYGAIDIPGIVATLGFYYNYMSGNAYSSDLFLPRYIDPDPVASWVDDLFIRGEERGTFRYGGMHDVDIRLEKVFHFDRFRLGLLADVFNLLNDNGVTSYQTEVRPGLEYQFGDVRRIRGPRTFRLGLRFEF
jgi:hypothetical protein